MKKILIASVLLASAGQVMAYQAEVSGQLQTADYIDRLTLGGEFYLNGVNGTTGPLAEAAFLEQATSVRASYIDLDYGSGVSGGGKYVHKDTGFYAEGDIFLGDLDGVQIGGGLYLDSNTTVGLSYFSSDFIDSLTGEFKHLLFQNNGTYIDMQASITSAEQDYTFRTLDTTIFAVSGDYYFDKTMSLGGGVSVITGDADGTEFSFVGQKFLDQNIALKAGLDYIDYDLADSDVGLNLGATFRF